jgi:hypothetical protein
VVDGDCWAEMASTSTKWWVEVWGDEDTLAEGCLEVEGLKGEDDIVSSGSTFTTTVPFEAVPSWLLPAEGQEINCDILRLGYDMTFFGAAEHKDNRQTKKKEDMDKPLGTRDYISFFSWTGIQGKVNSQIKRRLKADRLQ